jgi:hypothetical protein
VSIDATGVPQQGPGGAADDARMAAVAMVYSLAGPELPTIPGGDSGVSP